MRGRRLGVLVAIVALMLPDLAGAGNFSPATSFILSSRKTLANPWVTVRVAQDKGEEEISKVLLRVPPGFMIPADAAIRSGEQLGGGTIEIAAGPACAGGAGSMPFRTDVKIVERDRSPAERARGVFAVWVIDLRPVATIDLLIRGSRATGWQLSGTVPQNSLTCPPFVFQATLFQRSSQSNKMVFRNPAAPGRYVFQAIYVGARGSKAVNRQPIVIVR